MNAIINTKSVSTGVPDLESMIQSRKEEAEKEIEQIKATFRLNASLFLKKGMRDITDAYIASKVTPHSAPKRYVTSVFIDLILDGIDGNSVSQRNAFRLHRDTYRDKNRRPGAWEEQSKFKFWDPILQDVYAVAIHALEKDMDLVAPSLPYALRVAKGDSSSSAIPKWVGPSYSLNDKIEDRCKISTMFHYYWEHTGGFRSLQGVVYARARLDFFADFTKTGAEAEAERLAFIEKSRESVAYLKWLKDNTKVVPKQIILCCCKWTYNTKIRPAVSFETWKETIAKPEVSYGATVENETDPDEYTPTYLISESGISFQLRERQPFLASHNDYY